MFRRCLYVVIILWSVVFTTGQGFAASTKVDARSKALAHYILANQQEMNGDHEAAYAAYEKSIQFDPNQIASRLKIASYDIRQDRLAKAIRELELIIKKNPQTYQAYYLLALVYSTQKQYDLAIGYYEKVLPFLSPREVLALEVRSLLAQLFIAQNHWDKAIEQCLALLEQDPKHVLANYLVGSLYLDTGRIDQAIPFLKITLSRQPQHDGALNGLAYAYAQKGIQLPQAQAMVQKALSIDPDNGAYYDTYGWVLFKQGLYADSIMALQKAESLIKDAIIYEHLGDVYEAVNQMSLARQYWLKALVLKPDDTQVRKKLDLLEKNQASQVAPVSP